MAVAKRKKDPAAVALGRKGGKKGGPARAARLTPDQRIASARKAAQARWAKAKTADNYIVVRAKKMTKIGKQIQGAPFVVSTSDHVVVDTSDNAVLEILSRIKAATHRSELRKLSEQLEHVIFHKQHSHS